jgi:hypothetical protein
MLWKQENRKNESNTRIGECRAAMLKARRSWHTTWGLGSRVLASRPLLSLQERKQCFPRNSDQHKKKNLKTSTLGFTPKETKIEHATMMPYLLSCFSKSPYTLKNPVSFLVCQLKI